MESGIVVVDIMFIAFLKKKFKTVTLRLNPR